MSYEGPIEPRMTFVLMPQGDKPKQVVGVLTTKDGKVIAHDGKEIDETEFRTRACIVTAE